MPIRPLFVSLLGALSITAATFTRGTDSTTDINGRTPVLVELFTSEGCSSCPPADRFLEKLDRQPVPGAEMIVLSEHVDYWNGIGWKDPYSARFYSERQSSYAQRLGLNSVYTPQMVVDGATEFVGSNPDLAEKAFRKALTVRKLPIDVSSVSAINPGAVHAHITMSSLERSYSSRAEIYAALALNRAESQVSSGENAGHRLTHVSVARTLTKIGEVKAGEAFSEDILLKVEPGIQYSNLRLVVFVQEPRQGRVLGAARVAVVAP